MDSKVITTRYGVAYDFNLSPFKEKIIYDHEELEFIFSSDLYRTKFIEKLEDNRNKINESLSKRFGFRIMNNKLCDIKLYTSIEKRGFLINTNQERIECLSNIILDGDNLTIMN